MTPRPPLPGFPNLPTFLLFAVVVLGLGGCEKSKPPVTTSAPAPAARSVGKPLTDEECRAVGEQISKAVKSGDVAGFDRLIDWDAVNQASTSGIDAPEASRKNFIKGLDQARLGGKGVANVIVEAVKKGGSYTLLRVHTRDNRPWLMFRLLLPEAGVNYHDLPLARRPDGKVKAMDIYIGLSGELLSQTFRRGFIQALAQAPGNSLIGRLTGSDQKYAKYLKSLGEMGEAARAGQYARMMEIYKASPAELKKEKNVLLLRLQAAQNLGDDAEYSKSIEDFRAEYPNDACIDILSIDYYVLKKQFDQSLACIDRLDKAIGGDPYLEVLRAGAHIEQGNFAAARADLKKAIDAEPGLVDAYWSLVNVSLQDKNFDETLKTLRTIREKFGIEIGDLTQVPLYKDFAASPQYQEFLKNRNGGGEKAVEK